MKQLQFATKASLNANTPSAIKRIYQILGLLSTIWIIISPNFPEIPEHTQNIVLRLIGASNAVIYAICQAFGYVDTDTIENKPE